VSTKLTNIAGLPRANSQRALDMRIKTWDLLNGGGKVVFLTATPIMNTLGEAYVMQLYLQERDLEAAGIHHFDEWVSLYAEAVMSFEMKPDGSGFRMNTRLGAFVNLPEMSAMWRQCMTIRTKAQMRLPEPSQVTGKPIPVEVPASEALKAFVHSLAARADRIAHGQVDPSTDNMLKVTHEGRMAALDYRLIAPGAHRRKHNKIMACVKRVKAIYDTFAPLKGTQLIFCDLATPKGGKDSSPSTRTTSAMDSDAEAADDRGGDTEAEQHLTNFVYHEIRAELGTLGIPAHEVAFIHDAKTKAQRDALFAAMNEGRVRVLIGSTNKMSAGMNVQKRLVAEHNLDCPWRPGDLKQRYGRILRQGNLWPTVYIFTYVTPGSFDGYLWQLVEAKARFIEQGLAGEITARRVEDTSDVVLSAAEVKAIASGNPLVVKKVKLETELSRLERIRSVQKSSINEFGWKRRSLERDTADLHTRRTVVEAACTILAAHPRSDDAWEAHVATQLGSDTFTPFTQRKEAGQAIRTITDGYHHAALMMRDNLKHVVGRYRGLDIMLWAHRQGETQLSFTLPDNQQFITGFGATTELGVFQSADYQLGRVHVATVDDRIADRVADMAAIDDEVARLQVWDQQHQYDDMQEELRLLNAELSMTKDAAPASDPAAEDATAALAGIADLLSMDAETEVDWASPISIPLAFEAMTFMHAEVQAQAERVATPAAMAVGKTTPPQLGAALRLLDHTPAAVPSVQLPTTASTRAPAPAVTPVWNEVPVTSKKTKQPVAVQYSMF
jgi:superfamily II DNA/RNA helicase